MIACHFAAKSWAEDGGESGYTDAMELLDLGLHLIGDESEEVIVSDSCMSAFSFDLKKGKV